MPSPSKIEPSVRELSTTARLFIGLGIAPKGNYSKAMVERGIVQAQQAIGPIEKDSLDNQIKTLASEIAPIEKSTNQMISKKGIDLHENLNGIANNSKSYHDDVTKTKTSVAELESKYQKIKNLTLSEAETLSKALKRARETVDDTLKPKRAKIEAELSNLHKATKKAAVEAKYAPTPAKAGGRG